MINAIHGLMGGSKLLCDELPNVLSAFSFRKLRTAYGGAAFRVKRVSDNVETDINFSGLYADTTALTAFLGASTGKIVTWYDQIRSSNLTVTTTAPQLMIASVAGINRIVVRYTGSEDLSGGVTGTLPTSTDLAINTVTANVSGNSAGAIASFGSYSPPKIRANYVISNKYYSVAGGSSSNIDTTISETVPATFTTRFNWNNIPGNTGDIIGFVNGVKKVNALTVPLESPVIFSLFVGIALTPGDYFMGDILEIIRSNDTWTDANILFKQTNQQTYYGL